MTDAKMYAIPQQQTNSTQNIACCYTELRSYGITDYPQSQCQYRTKEEA